MQKLGDPENFLALTLYDAIQPEEKLLVQIGADDERILEGEQGRAKRVCSSVVCKPVVFNAATGCNAQLNRILALSSDADLGKTDEA